MTEPVWMPMVRIGNDKADLVWREWPDGKQESRLASSFTPEDPDYANIMRLVAEGKLTIAPASP